jgi:hypothetical protein
MRLDPVGEGVALGAIENGGEELHHGRIGVQRRERLSVGIAPMAQDEAFRD